MRNKIIKTFTLIAIFTLSISMNLLAQVYKLKATSFSLKTKNDYKWGEAESSNVLITFNLDKDRITIYSKTTQVYDIVEYEGKTKDSDGDDIFSYYCVDVDGVNCRVKWLQLHSQNGRMQMYVYYADLSLLYNIYSLD